MALAASLPPVELSPQNQDLNDELEKDIARVRAEIQSLTKRKTLLTSSLLSSTKLQSHLTTRDAPRTGGFSIDQTPLQSQNQHNQTNVHRLALGVTSFPFTDPSPDTSNRPLLGIRFDIPSRNGRFEKAPYYIFLKRAGEDTSNDAADNANPRATSSGDSLKIHHHTIPALVPLQDYEARYLPQVTNHSAYNGQRRDEGYFSPSSSTGQENGGNSDNDIVMQEDISKPPNNHTDTTKSTQDLHALVTAVRHDLVSWQLRSDAISLLVEQLNLSDTGGSRSNDVAKFSLLSLQATATDARFCRIVWQNGTVGRLRLTDDGHIDRAVVIGEVGDDRRTDRMEDLERMLCSGKDGGKLSIDELAQCLGKIEAKMNERSSPLGTDDEYDGGT